MITEHLCRCIGYDLFAYRGRYGDEQVGRNKGGMLDEGTSCLIGNGGHMQASSENAGIFIIKILVMAKKMTFPYTFSVN